MNEEKKEDNREILSDMSLKDAIIRCGELQLSFEDICRLLAGKANPKQLMRDLQNPDSLAHAWYQKGMAEGNLKLNIDLEANVGNPKAKDAYKNLSEERSRQIVNRKLDELFGPS